jgi:hypothetical protein
MIEKEPPRLCGRHDERFEHDSFNLGSPSHWVVSRVVAGGPGQQRRHLDADGRSPVASRRTTSRVDPGRPGPDRGLPAGRAFRIGGRSSRRYLRQATPTDGGPGVPGHRRSGACGADVRRPDAPDAAVDFHIPDRLRIGDNGARVSGARSGPRTARPAPLGRGALIDQHQPGEGRGPRDRWRPHCKSRRGRSLCAQHRDVSAVPAGTPGLAPACRRNLEVR